MNTTVDQDEINQFAKDSAHWWDEAGPFKPLHRLNPVRMAYIRTQICDHFNLDQKTLTPLEGLNIIDIGCGGGLVCEPLARLGGTITGADADKNAIKVAKEHAKASGLKIKYLNKPAEQILSSPRKRESIDQTDKDPRGRGKSRQLYDVVLALEILEHVNEPQDFVQACAELLKPGGLIIFSTLNRNPKSFLLGIVAAEYILRWVPHGTHNWKKFIKPSELSRMCRAAELKPHDITGLMYNPLQDEFKLCKRDLDVNYFLTAKK